MDITHLKSFLAIADTGSFTKAAEGLFSTQPTLSRHVALLESELGVKLIDRDKHHVRLTKAGEVLFAEGKRWIADMISIERRLSMYSEANSNHLDIICSPMYSQILRTAYQKFREQYPDITCNIRQVVSGMELSVVEQNDADIGILFWSPEITSIPSLDYRVISREKMCLVSGADAAIAQKGSLRLKDFRNETLLIARSPMTPWLKKIHSSVEAYFKSIIYVDNLETITLNLSTNQGISIWPEIVVKDTQNYSKALNVPEFSEYTTLYAVWVKENPNQNIRRFLEMFPKEDQASLRCLFH
ncbi:MAG: LysR family transcriptional regulator [Parasporobacterium sp.]|nr:LysR family transcriptional regulator [Parasporobacterium sp.]